MSEARITNPTQSTFNSFGMYEGRLAGTIEMSQDTSWELHPQGDEFLYLLSGAIDVVLQNSDREEIIELRAGAAYIIPQGLWHQKRVRLPSNLLFITPLNGTQHRSV